MNRTSPARATSPADDYRRTARRLRHEFRSNPAALYRSLRDLANDADRQAAGRPAAESCSSRSEPVLVRRVDRNPGILPVRSQTDADVFAAMVTTELDGPILRYSRRACLLKRAGQLGIGRFDANLIIASVQHRVRASVAHTTAAGHSLWSWVALAFVAVEFAVLAAGWLVWTR